MAAAYGFHLCKNHPFIDGNKRISLVAIDIFLQRNSHQLVASEYNADEAIMRQSTGQLTKEELTEWVKTKSSILSDSLRKNPSAKLYITYWKFKKFPSLGWLAALTKKFRCSIAES